MVINEPVVEFNLPEISEETKNKILLGLGITGICIAAVGFVLIIRDRNRMVAALNVSGMAIENLGLMDKVTKEMARITGTV